MNLHKFLEAKPLYYEKIDYDRFPYIYSKIKDNFNLPKIIHVVGTNAKGSTGRALAYILHVRGFNVGHYSSPHILKFNERIWFNGHDIDDILLENTHKKLQKIVDDSDLEELSYFEYTTLLAMLFFCKNCEYIVLEAGLGGQYDATNVFEKNLSIITPIGYDHQSFLGHSIEDISQTKLNSVNNDLLIAKQYEKKVYKLAFDRINKIQKNLYFANNYLYDNFATAFCAYRLLGFEPKIDLLKNITIFGRCHKIYSNVTIDVGHNIMAATAILTAFSSKKVILVYNSYRDKEYIAILTILKPIIKEVQIINVIDDRALNKEELENTLNLLEIKYSNYKNIDENCEYLVFGSFSVVEAFLNAKNK